MLTRWESDVSSTLKPAKSELKLPSCEPTEAFKSMKNLLLFYDFTNSEAQWTDGAGIKNTSAKITIHGGYTTKKGRFEAPQKDVKMKEQSRPINGRIFENR